MAFENIHTAYVAEAVELPTAIELVNLLESGMTRQEIADEYGCSESTVSGRLQASGLLDKRPDPDDEPRPKVLGFPVLPQAACTEVRDPETFFPLPNDPARLEQARAYCRRCPAIKPCLIWALSHHEAGVWAATTEEQRKALLDRHARSAS